MLQEGGTFPLLVKEKARVRFTLKSVHCLRKAIFYGGMTETRLGIPAAMWKAELWQ